VRGVLLRRIPALDSELFGRVARTHTPALDRIIPTLSRAANNSQLWLGIAVHLATFGGRRGKRGALRGMSSIAATSLLVNQGVKRVVRRPRPSLRHVPAVRRLPVQPLTTSFPSGHAASAGAFTAGVAAELPEITPVIASLAAAVAYSRVYVGVHYPADVAVGVGTGVGMAFATRRIWPAEPRRTKRVKAGGERRWLPPNRDGEGLALVINPGAGPELGQPPLEEMQRRLPRARIVEIGQGEELDTVLRRAAERCAVLGMFGGDGSALCAAEAALAAGRPLLVLPGGTLNHLARDLGIESADDALEALERGQAVEIEVAAIDGRPFLNSASFGATTRMVDARGRLERKLGRWPAQAAAVLGTLSRGRPQPMLIDGKESRLWMAFIGNCRYKPEGFAPSWRPRLDDGLLDIRLIEATGRWSRLRVALAVLTGRLSRCRAYRRWEAPALEVDSRNDRVRLARDGNTFDGSARFRVQKLPQRLTVYTPSR
jgi:diacylglycerol kinase family enzyme/membrane-associated phospholipid phosphatase